MSDNPYKAGIGEIQDGGGFELMSMRTLRFIMVVGLVGGVCGVVLGGAVGVMAPAYYNTLFNSQGDPAFDAVRMGVALGLFQGFGGGVGLGAFLAVAEAWLKSRR